MCVGVGGGGWGSKAPFITFRILRVSSIKDFHPRSHSSLVLEPGIICTFLIHSGSLQNMLAALFTLV